MYVLAVTDAAGWVTAAVAVIVLVLNMIAGAIRFEVRMTRVETQLATLQDEVDLLLRRSEQRRSTDWGSPGP